jgi:cytoskeletal protein RodZ
MSFVFFFFVFPSKSRLVTRLGSRKKERKEKKRKKERKKKKKKKKKKKEVLLLGKQGFLVVLFLFPLPKILD